MAVHHPGDLAQELGNLQNLITQLVKQAAQNASFGSAGLRVYGGGWIVIENGGLSVTGTAEVSGTLTGTGNFKWNGNSELNGPWFLNGTGRITGDTTGTGRLKWEGAWSLDGNGKITGNVEVTGDADFLGDVTIRKTLDVMATTRLRGKTTLEDDLTITAGGKIRVGDMVIDPAGYGKIRFENGTEVRAHAGGVAIENGVSSVTVTPSFTRIGVGSSGVYVDGTGISMTNVPLVAHPDLPSGALVRLGDRICQVG